MSEEQLKAFLAKVSNDVGLQRRLSKLDSLDQILSLALQEGFQFTQADWQKHIKLGSADLSDAELETVAGGCFNSGASHWGDGGQCGSEFTCANTGLCDC